MARAMTLERLRRHARSNSLFAPTTLRRAIDRLGFVQADPIRSPARAQDLILRLRVKDYRNGDLDRQYARLDLEEEYLYAYGFVPRATWRLLHPRPSRRLSQTDRRLLDFVFEAQSTHPRDVDALLGVRRERNAWGGFSKANTKRLHTLHYDGHVRVAGRRDGIRLYARALPLTDVLDPSERLRQLVLRIADIFAPISVRSLRFVVRHLGHAAPSLSGRKTIVSDLVASGDLSSATVDGQTYVWVRPVVLTTPSDRVRFLAPFDPMVWDRDRFEHLWGWSYRFEAYTPPARRERGYYAMPMLWRDDAIGWVNISAAKGQLSVEPGFVHGAPQDPTFAREFADEVDRFRTFLQPRPGPDA